MVEKIDISSMIRSVLEVEFSSERLFGGHNYLLEVKEVQEVKED